jgi:hypothetical protein
MFMCVGFKNIMNLDSQASFDGVKDLAKSMSSMKSRSLAKLTLSDLPREYRDAYERTSEYFKTSHLTPKIGGKDKSYFTLLDPSTYRTSRDGPELETMLNDQIKKYDEFKLRTQNDAIQIYEAERLRYSMSEAMRERDGKIEQKRFERAKRYVSDLLWW